MKNEKRCSERTVGELVHMDTGKKVKLLEVLKMRNDASAMLSNRVMED
jgi:hypothetical protein